VTDGTCMMKSWPDTLVCEIFTLLASSTVPLPVKVEWKIVEH